MNIKLAECEIAKPIVSLLFVALVSAGLCMAQETATSEAPQAAEVKVPDTQETLTNTDQQPSELAQQTTSAPESQQTEQGLGTAGEINPTTGKKIQGTENPPEPESHGTRLRWQSLPGNILLHDQPAIWTSPFHMSAQDAKYWLIFGAAFAAMIPFDFRASNALPNTTAQVNAGNWASNIGADYTLYPIFGAFYLTGKLGENPRARDTARIGIEALADSEIVVNVLKYATNRKRPLDGGSGHFWNGGNGATNGPSFPSGHSIETWAFAHVIASEFSDTKWVPVVTYSFASAVPAARFFARKHFASDTFAGAVMGWFIGDFVYSHHHAPSEHSKVVSWLGDHVHFGLD